MSTTELYLPAPFQRATDTHQGENKKKFDIDSFDISVVNFEEMMTFFDKKTENQKTNIKKKKLNYSSESIW